MQFTISGAHTVLLFKSELNSAHQRRSFGSVGSVLCSLESSVILLEVRVGLRICRFLFHEYSLESNTGGAG